MQNKDRACGRDDAIILYGARQGLSVKEVAWYRGSPSAEWAVPPGVWVEGGWVSITLLPPFIHRKRSEMAWSNLDTTHVTIKWAYPSNHKHKIAKRKHAESKSILRQEYLPILKLNGIWY